MRAFAAIAQHLIDAGYTAPQAAGLKQAVQFFGHTRQAIKNYAGEELDIKSYEVDMRHLLNTYIQADDAYTLGELEKFSLVELIVKTGIHDAIAKKLNQAGKLSEQVVLESIINNLRKTIIQQQLTNPHFYAKMSQLLEDLIQQAKSASASYEELLRQAAALAQDIVNKDQQGNYPKILDGNPETQLLYDNLASIQTSGFQCPDNDEEKAQLALSIDQTIRNEAPANWAGDSVRENQVKNALFGILNRDHDATLALFDIIKNQAGYQWQPPLNSVM